MRKARVIWCRRIASNSKPLMLLLGVITMVVAVVYYNHKLALAGEVLVLITFVTMLATKLYYARSK